MLNTNKGRITMPEKKVKKPVAKPAAAKKPVAKKAPAKKTVTKKAPVKKVAAPVVEPMPCGCNHACACGEKCACAKKKCSFGRFIKKLIVFLIIFAMGYAVAKVCNDGPRGKMKPRPQFENGCLVVKCPKMAEKVPMMDADQDGCVTRAEFRAARKAMKRGPKPAAPVADAPVAPEMAE